MGYNRNIKSTDTFVDEEYKGKRLLDKLFQILIDFVKQENIRFFYLFLYRQMFNVEPFLYIY